MKIILGIGLLVLLSSAKCQPTTTREALRVSDLKFRSIFGFHPFDSTNVYSLLGTGFFRTPRSEDSDSLIDAWIESHPEARIVPVTSFGPTRIADRKSKMTYCWIIDEQDTLNNYLVRHGCFPGGTMQRLQTWNEMTKQERQLYKRDDRPNVTVYVDKKTYDKFLAEINSAEMFARKTGLGIWGEAK